MPPKSKKQARLLGLIAGGEIPRKKTGLSKAKAKEMLRGAKLKKLPTRVKKTTTKRRRTKKRRR